MNLSTSSSSSQQNANSASNYENKQGESSLMNEISTLRSRLEELNGVDSPVMNRPRSQSALRDGGQREPPVMAEESALVIQLRKELSNLEQEKAEMELTCKPFLPFSGARYARNKVTHPICLSFLYISDESNVQSSVRKSNDNRKLAYSAGTERKNGGNSTATT
jgi:hypothetical protein